MAPPLHDSRAARRPAPRSRLGALCLALAAAWCPGCGEPDDREPPAEAGAGRSAAAVTRPESGAVVPAPPPPGFWKRARVSSRDPDLNAEDREYVRRLESLGYVTGSVTPSDARVVSVHDEERAHAGLNFVTSGHEPGALLVDMQGRVLYRWHAALKSVWPDAEHDDPGYWRRAYLYPNGDVLAVYGGRGLMKLDRDSRVIWASDVYAHHDLDVLPNGDIYVLTREYNRVEGMNDGLPLIEDFVSILGADGREKRKVSLLEALMKSEFRDLYQVERPALGDLLHSNSIEVLDGSIADRVPAFAAGRVLVSLAVPSLIAVVDLDSERVVWAHRGDFVRQHDPKILANGNLMFFDNGGRRRGISRILEIDPGSLERRWVYRGSKREPFFSETCGTAQRLANGNTLITESDNGRALEVDRRGRIVWQFHNPYRAGPQREFVAALFEVQRLPEAFPVDWIAGGAGATP